MSIGQQEPSIRVEALEIGIDPMSDIIGSKHNILDMDTDCQGECR